MILMSGKPEQHTFHKLVTVNSFLSVVSKRELDLPLQKRALFVEFGCCNVRWSVGMICRGKGLFLHWP